MAENCWHFVDWYGKVFRHWSLETNSRWKMKRPLALLTMGFVLSLMLLSTVTGSTSVRQGFYLCNLGDWNRASDAGEVQINVCSNGYGSSQTFVQYAIKYGSLTIAAGGCNGGPCSNPTAVGVNDNAYLVLRFYPSYISGLQVIMSGSNGHAQWVWVPYNQNNYQDCNPYYDFCYSGPSSCGYQSCSAVVFRIPCTPLTVNVFFSL